MFELTPFVRRNSLSAFDPFRDFDALERAFFSPSSAPSSRGFRTDIRETKDSFILEADLPGFKKEDISLELDGDYLTVSAEQKSENEEKNGEYVRRERRCGSFSRTFDVSSAKAEAITAAYENGVLTVTLPKKDEEVITTRKIDIQ